MFALPRVSNTSASSTWPNYNTPLGERVRVYAFWPTQIGASVPGYEMVDTGHPFVERVLTAAREEQDRRDVRQRRRARARGQSRCAS